MRKNTFLTMAIAITVMSLLLVTRDQIRANNLSGPALTGQVSSQKEGLMEGVVIGAKVAAPFWDDGAWFRHVVPFVGGGAGSSTTPTGA